MSAPTHCHLCGKPFARHTNGRIKPCNCIEERAKLVNLGMRALDAVKHCQGDMKPHMKDNDAAMRGTPSTKWTTEQIQIARLTDRYINRRHE